MPFEPGHVGNRRGRPPKKRSLTALLEKSLSEKITTKDDRIVTKKQLISELVGQFIATGQATLANGRVLELDEIPAWANLVKWVYAQIDGPPRQELDITTNSVTISSDEYAAAIEKVKKLEESQSGDS